MMRRGRHRLPQRDPVPWLRDLARAWVLQFARTVRAWCRDPHLYLVAGITCLVAAAVLAVVTR